MSCITCAASLTTRTSKAIPSRPVANSVIVRREPPMIRGSAALASIGAGPAAEPSASTPAAHTAFTLARQTNVPESPNAGSSKNVEVNVPATAPKVFAPYTPALTRPSPRASRTSRSSAVNVPPIAAVAGNSTKVGNAKLAAHSRAGAGSVPSRGDKARPAAGSSQMQIRPQRPMTASNAMYAVRGDLVRRITRSRANAPSASPAKKPATAPSTAIISLPSARLNWRVHTIS